MAKKLTTEVILPLLGANRVKASKWAMKLLHPFFRHPVVYMTMVGSRYVFLHTNFFFLTLSLYSSSYTDLEFWP